MTELQKWLRNVRHLRMKISDTVDCYIPSEDDAIIQKNLKRAIIGLHRATVALDYAERRARTNALVQRYGKGVVRGHRK